MKKIKKYALLALTLACFATAAHARRDELRHEDVLIEKGQTFSGDVATDKSITVNGVLDGDAVSIGGSSVTVNGEVTGDIVSMGGAIFIPGTAAGDVVSVGGPIGISGKVSGNVASVGGRVSLSGAGQVDGDISAVGGSVVKSENTVLRGEVRNLDIRALRNVLPRVLRLSRYASGGDRRKLNPWLIGGLIGLGFAILFSIVITVFILLLLPAVFFPRNVETVAAAISGDMWRACGTGALMLMGFFPGLVLMVVSVLGIPLVPFALALFAAAGVLGLSAFSVVLQSRFFEGIKKAGPAGLPGKAAAGGGVMVLLLFFGKMIPFIGGILSLAGLMLMAFGVMLGLGAVWMTRMGTRGRNSPAARPQAQGPGTAATA